LRLFSLTLSNNDVIHSYMSVFNISFAVCVSLQKQVGCFNHRVVTMVADKLKRQWLWDVYSWY